MTQPRANATSNATWLAALLAILIGLAASLNALGFHTVTGLLFNTDMLLPVDLLHDVTLGVDVARQFQLPRVPSFFPDLAVMALLRPIWVGWHAPLLAYALLSAAALIVMTARLAARLGGPSWAMCLMVTAALFALLLLPGADWLGLPTPAIFALMPVIHSGSTLLVFAAVLLVLPARRSVRPVLLAALAGLIFLASLSDKLFDVAFVLPCLAALAAVNLVRLRARQPISRPDLAIGMVLVVSVVAGLGAERWLFRVWLVRQPDIPLSLRDLQNWRWDYAARPELWLVAFCLIAGAVLLWRLRHRLEPFLLWLVAASTACLMAFFMLFYVDHDSLRYVQVLFWWLIVLATVQLGRIGARALLVACGGVAGLLVVALLLTPERVLSPPVLRWRDPAASCLQELAAQGRIHQGLAEIWTARGLEISTDWQVPVAQLANTGAVYVWGNNRLFYAQDHRNPTLPARFDFVVMRDMRPQAVRARFGPPGEIVACGPDQVWLYPAGLTLQSAG